METEGWERFAVMQKCQSKKTDGTQEKKTQLALKNHLGEPRVKSKADENI